jgi:16S rRNA (guanine966-N2)-methyltransferase
MLGSMRVIAGQFRSRQLIAPRGQNTRPTSDRLRETLFSVLAPRLAECRFADLYAGSGAVGIEALSRGAAFCVFVERAPAALVALRKNLVTLGLIEATTVDTRSAARALLANGERKPFDIVFLDPPYEAGQEYTTTMGFLGEQSGTLLAEGGLVIAEHARRLPLPDRFGALQRTRLLEQGDAALSFYAPTRSDIP